MLWGLRGGLERDIGFVELGITVVEVRHRDWGRLQDWESLPEGWVWGLRGRPRDWEVGKK